MSLFLKLHQLLAAMPAVTLFGPLLFGLAVLVALHYLKLTRQLREQFSRQQRVAVELRTLSTAVEQSPASIVITDRQGSIRYVNPAFCRLTGYSLEEALGQNPKILKGSDHPPEFYRAMWETLDSGREWRGEFLNRRKDGTLFWELASISPILDERGEISHFVGVKENITERKQRLEHLDQMAHYDKLTGLPNRALFFDRLGCIVAQCRREGRKFALLFIDLDGFKEVNDSFGHEAGDRVLQETARRLRGCIRDSDTAARMGGDEFTVILANLADGEHAALVARKILQAFPEPIVLADGNSCRIGASIGISFYPGDSREIETLVGAADSAMYEVKRDGKNGFRLFSQTGTVRTQGRGRVALVRGQAGG